MPVVSSQYWNQVHGFTPEDVRKDEEGLQTMRTLGENMAWLLRCIEAGREAGVPKPEYEPWVATNFIHGKMNVWDIVLGLAVWAGIAGALKYMGKTQGCGGRCAECPHPCRSRSGKS